MTAGEPAAVAPVADGDGDVLGPDARRGSRRQRAVRSAAMNASSPTAAAQRGVATSAKCSVTSRSPTAGTPAAAARIAHFA